PHARLWELQDVGVGELRNGTNHLATLSDLAKDLPPRQIYLIVVEILCNPNYLLRPYFILKSSIRFMA
ncbi:MAG: hypothetical protein JSW12_10585, partial [Deltaproteobacteria bacterium]